MTGLNQVDTHSMKLALLTNFVPPYRRPLYEALHRRFRDLHVFVSTPMESNRSWTPEWGGLRVTVQKTITLSTHHWRYSEFGEKSHVHIPVDTLFQLKKYRPDAILTAELGFRTLFAVLYRQLNRRTAVVPWLDLATHSESRVGALRASIRRTMLAMSQAVITNGVSADEYARSLGVPAERIFQSPFSVPAEDFASAPIPRPPELSHRLIYAGQLIERKGILPFMEALHRWCTEHPGRQVEFRFVGDGPLRSRLEQRPLPPNLHLQFRPGVPYAQMVGEYADAGILVLPTFSDTWGMVVSEAMASGLPVLGSRYAQAVEHYVVDGETGWVFTPDRQDLMSSAIDRALTASTQTLARMQRAARDLAERATVDASADGMARAIGFARAMRSV
jgi:glycosyltransferase involved in cell wall biosynthesis